jgi:hypothetical protein
MTEVFPEPIRNLPEADIPLSGIKAYLSQAENHQITFMEITERPPSLYGLELLLGL